MHEFAFGNLPEKSETVLRLSKVARELGFFVASTISGRCPRVMLGGTEQFENQKESLLTKRSLRKNLIALRSLGEVTIIGFTDGAVIS
jgi:hypothetical protein